MRRLLFLFVGLGIVLWGRALLMGGMATHDVVLRDGLLVVALGLTIFAFNGRRPIEMEESTAASPLSITRGILAAIGFAGALAGGIWLSLLLTGQLNTGGLGLPLFVWLTALAVGLLVLVQRQRRPVNVTPDVWSVEKARHYLQHKGMAHRQVMQDWLPLHKRTITFALIVLILAALFVRIWNFAGLPDDCLPGQCEAVLNAVDFARTGDLPSLVQGASPLYTLTTGTVLGLFGVSATTTLLLGLFLGIGSLLLFYRAAIRFVSPASALLGLLLVVFSPLHVIWSRFPSPALVLLLLVTALLALRPAPGQPQTPGRWAATGGLAGLTLFAAPIPLTWLLLLWYLVTLPRRWPNQAFYLLALLSTALPRLALGIESGYFDGVVPTQFFGQATSLAAQILQDGGYLPGPLILLGAAYLIRHLRWKQAWVWTSGFLLIGLPIFATNQPTNIHLLSPLVALLFISAMVAVDQLVGEFVRVWKPALRPQRVWAVAASLLLGLMIIGGSARLQALGRQVNSSTDVSYAAIGTFLHQRFAASLDNGSDDATLILVPRAVLDNPSTQLAARGVIPYFSHVVPLDPVAHLPFTDPPDVERGTGTLLYIVPGQDIVPGIVPGRDTDLSVYLSALYPGLVAEPINDRDGRPVARAYSVTRATIASAQGLPVVYFAGDEVGSPQDAVESRREGPLDLPWDTEPPIAAPFVMTGQGALYIPEAGIYGFRMEGRPTTHARMDFAVPVSSGPVLDTAAGISEIVVDLPQGLLALNLTIRSGAEASHTSLQWKRPGGEWEPIPRQALYGVNADLGKGLLARYYGYTEGEEQPQGFDNLAAAPLVGWRVEPWLEANQLMPVSRAVVWQAKLAAPLEGSYTFAVDGLGAHQLEIDGILLLDSSSGETDNASLLLSQGWHDLTLRYQPGGASDVQLRWRPPGSGMAKIPYGYLLPIPPGISTDHVALPPPPVQEVEPTLAGDGTLPRPEASIEFQPASSAGLPTDLPALPFELMWQVGSCGSDMEQFQQPRGVALNLYNELVYVADQGNKRVILLELRDGSLVDFYTDESFEEPFDLDVNLLGQVYLLDAVTQTIYRFEEPEGVAVVQPSATAFYRPRGMGVSLDGNIFVADTGGARVVKLNSADGTVALQVGGPDSPLGQGQPVDVMVLPTGAIYVTTAQDGMLWRLDTGESWPAVAPANTFDAPHLAGLPTSSFFVTDPERRLVTYYNEAGNPLGQLYSDLFVKPVGISTMILDEQVLLAISDSATCQVSLWRAPLDGLPQ